MKVTIIHQYYKHPEEGGAIRSYYLAQHLQQKGHDVSIITSWNQSSKKVNANGITIHYLGVPYSNNLSFVKRKIAFISFLLRATLKALLLKRPDVYYAISTPLSIGVIALVVKWLKRRPYFFEVGDLWPEVPVKMGLIENRFFIRLLYALERQVYRSAKGVIALSEPIATYVKSKCTVPVTTVTNLADNRFYSPSTRTDATQLTIGYFGALGMANHLEYLLDAALYTKDKKMAVQYIIAGEGYEHKRIAQRIAEQQLHNVSLLPFKNKDGIRALTNQCDLFYISFAPYSILGTGSPNKYFDGLAAGKGIVINFESWIQKDLERYNAGFYYDPKHPETLASWLQFLLENPEDLEGIKKNARQLAKDAYDTEKQLKRWMSFITE